MPRTAVSLWLPILLLTLAGIVRAQEPGTPAPEAQAQKEPPKKAAPQKKPAPKKAAVTRVADADADYPIQGEYIGQVAGLGEAGLQVVALGDQKFDAFLLRGGLPGAGWDRQAKEQFSGARNDGVATLTSDQHQISIQGSQAIVRNPAGATVGRLSEIHRVSPTLGLPAPAGATVLFANGHASELEGATVSPEGLLQVGATTKMPVEDFRLHVEFKTPYQPDQRGQGRGNSGVYIQRRYEVQILDSFGLDGVFNECGALYRQTPPDVNMALPPLTWQTYDIWFTAARFNEAGEKTSNARITVWHNGVPVHNNREIPSKTGAGQAETDKPLPIHFQNHGNPVEFRNLWIILGAQPHPAEQAAMQVSPSCCRCVCHCQRRCQRVGLLRRLFCRR